MDAQLASLLDRPEVREVRAIARARGAPILLVGGAVRDAMLGRAAPHDLDFAVQGDAVALARAVANALRADVYVMDAERGTARVLIPARDPDAGPGAPPDMILDFAACRGATWRDDLLARDFTINAIAVDLEEGRIVDVTGGLDDLRAGVIRATTEHAVADDPVRGLRAIRQAFALDMCIDAATLDQVRAVGAGILRPSAERVRDELREILGLAEAARAVRQLDALGLLEPIVPEIGPMRACEQSAPHRFTVLEHTFVVMEALDREILNFEFSILNSKLRIENSKFLLQLAALLHDCAKPDTRTVEPDGRVRFLGHEAAGADVAAARARALRLSGDEVSAVRTMVRIHMRPNQMAREMARDGRPPSPRALHRFFRDAGERAPLLALFAIADCYGKRGDATQPGDCAPSRQIAALLLERYAERYAPAAAPAPLVTGRDVIDLGVKPGPRIGAILDHVREAQMTGEIDTRDQALSLARDLASGT